VYTYITVHLCDIGVHIHYCPSL